MRKIFLIVFILLLKVGFVSAQLTYQTIYSNPEEINDGYVGLHYLAMDVGFSNMSGASLWSVGADVLYPINERLKIDVLGLYSLYSMEKKGPAFLFSGGVEFTIKSSNKQRKVPVLLSFSYEKDYLNQVEVQSWESVKLPGDVKNEWVARGGLYMRNSALEYNESFNYYDLTEMFQAGVFAGVGYNWRHYLHVQDSDGYKLAAGTFLRPYADILILPTTVELSLNGANAGEISETMGWRMGTVLQFKPYSENQNFDRKYNFFSNMLYRLEFGQRPIGGVYITTGVAYNLKRFWH